MYDSLAFRLYLVTHCSRTILPQETFITKKGSEYLCIRPMHFRASVVKLPQILTRAKHKIASVLALIIIISKRVESSQATIHKKTIVKATTHSRNEESDIHRKSSMQNRPFDV